MLGALDHPLGDPGRIHSEGLTARALIEHAREQVAGSLGARSREVMFCSSATEAIATVCAGASTLGDRQVVAATEHSAVRLAAERAGEVTVVPVDRGGRVDPRDIAAAATEAAVSVVHVQYGNHETGVTQPIDEIVAACADLDVLLHVDAAQAAGRVPIDFAALGVDLLTISSHKLGGPTGVGALLIRRGLRLDPLLLGGDQERARRAGLEHIGGIVGFGEVLSQIDVEAEGAEQARLTERVRRILRALDGVAEHGHPEHRLPHIAAATIEDIEPQAVLLGLDRAGIAAHSGSACSSESLEPSPVLEAMGIDAHHSLRVSTGWSNTDDDIDALEAALPRVLHELRALRPG
jgi:cysteine desulfurase